MPRTTQRLTQLLDALEAFYGPQTPRWPTDPWLFLIWWHCGYPPSEQRCTLGWTGLGEAVAVEPAQLLAARPAILARALKAGGMLPERRAARLKDIARRVRDEFSGDLATALAQRPLVAARKTLRSFPGIGTPGAERILLFAGLAPVAAVPSNCPYVVVRLECGREPLPYNAVYAKAQQLLEAQLPETLAARQRAYLLLQRHGQELCRPTKPKCGECPVAAQCTYLKKRARLPAK